MEQYSSSKKQIILFLWVLFLVGFYLISGYLAWNYIHTDKINSVHRHFERVSPYQQETGHTAVDKQHALTPPTNSVAEVHSGIYVDRIVKLSTKDTYWTVDFYIWFNWKNGGFNPGESFQIINGEILSKQQITSNNNKNRGEHYELYRVKATISKLFNITRYPLDDHLLTIRIEDQDHTWQSVRFIADRKETKLSSRVYVSGYQIYNTSLVSKPHAYQSHRGNPNALAEQAVHSQLIYGIWIKRHDMGFFIKIFQGLFASVAIALLAFFFGPQARASERISIGVGAFFAAIASGYISLNELPGAGLQTLTDMLNGQGMATIFLTLLATILAMRIARTEGQLPLARLFDRISFSLIFLGFSTFVLMTSLAAQTGSF